jgi:hypothetical protein
MMGVPTRRTWLGIGALLAVVVAIALAVTLPDDDTDDVTTGSTTSTASTTSSSSSTTSEPASTTSATTATTATEDHGFGYQALWPFRTVAEAEAWRDAAAPGGHRPWHLDAEQTALAFTTGFLGFDEIDRVVQSDIGATEAHVTVGYETTEPRPSPAAVIHLVRIGEGLDAPWEVVGTADELLTLENPAYGATVASPVTVGGHITGVDESLVVQVRQPSSPAPLGQTGGLPAGGMHSPWETTVSFDGATDPVLTIVVWTGGHYQGVERFAITGVRH